MHLVNELGHFSEINSTFHLREATFAQADINQRYENNTNWSTA